MVEPRTPAREVGGSILTQAPCCVNKQDTFTSQKVMVIPRIRHDLKIVYWDVKQKRNETKFRSVNPTKHIATLIIHMAANTFT